MPPIADRENEHLGPAIDDGIIKLRQMYLREIEKVKRGEDPKCIVRDPAKNQMIVIPAYEKWVPESERNLGQDVGSGIKDGWPGKSLKFTTRGTNADLASISMTSQCLSSET